MHSWVAGGVVAHTRGGSIATRAVRNSDVPRTVTLRNLDESSRKLLGHGDCIASPARPRLFVLSVRGQAGAGAHDDHAGGGGSEARAEPRRTVGPAARHDSSIENLNEAHALTEKVWESDSWVSDLCRCEALAEVAGRVDSGVHLVGDRPRFGSDRCRHRLSRGGVKPVRNPRAFRSAPWRS